jgi:hypothetical protein
MTEENLSPNPEEEEPQPQGPPQQQPPRTPPQTVTISTPLDRPEFDWFLTQYMEKLGIGDRKQAAISLTNMFYDMGLDPYSDLKELQEAMQQMNMLLKNMPNTPAALQVKETLGAMYSARAGRKLLDNMPKTSGDDPIMDRMERVLDKYVPMMMSMQMIGNMMNPQGYQQYQQRQPQEPKKEKAEIPEEVKNEMADMRKQLQETQALLKQQTEEKREKERSQEIINTINAEINPQIDRIRQQIETLTSSLQARAAEAPPPVQPQQSTELKEITENLRDAIEKFGEKAGAQKLNLDDLNVFLSTMETIEKRLKKEPTGEFDWKATVASTIGEIGREAVSVFKDIQVARSQQPSSIPPQQQPQAVEMQQVIKRQVQNFILTKLNQGATEMNMQEAAQATGLSLEQVNWAYNILVSEGWLKPGKQQPQTPAAPTTPQQPPTPPPEGGATSVPTKRREEQPFIET